MQCHRLVRVDGEHLHLPNKNKKDAVVVVDEKTEIPQTYIQKEQIRIDYYYQISKAEKKKELDLIKRNLINGFGPLPRETKTLLNSDRVRILLKGSLIEKVEASNNRLVLLVREPKKDFNTVGFFQSVQTFKHKNLLNYKYRKSREFGLKITFNVLEFFPSMGLLFSFLRFIKKHI